MSSVKAQQVLVVMMKVHRLHQRTLLKVLRTPSRKRLLAEAGAEAVSLKPLFLHQAEAGLSELQDPAGKQRPKENWLLVKLLLQRSRN